MRQTPASGIFLPALSPRPNAELPVTRHHLVRQIQFSELAAKFKQSDHMHWAVIIRLHSRPACSTLDVWARSCGPCTRSATISAVQSPCWQSATTATTSEPRSSQIHPDPPSLQPPAVRAISLWVGLAQRSQSPIRAHTQHQLCLG